MAVLQRLHQLLSTEASSEERSEAISRLRSPEDWTRMLRSSRTEPVLIFKHSTRCDISSHALSEVGDFLSRHQDVPFGIVDVVQDRSLSDEIANHTGIRHESPQLIAIANELPIFHASHWSINVNELERLLADSEE